MHDLTTQLTTCVIGLFWGDEGKGKIVDLLTEQADIVVRYNGGANAGHTVVVGGERFALHLVPSGALHAGKTGVIGPGVVLDPQVLLNEIDMLASRGISVLDRLKISTRCHLVMPYHQLEDRLSEAALSEEQRIGTTARGIGPCYADKVHRSTALRFCDLFQPAAFRQRLQRIVDSKNRFFQAIYHHTDTLHADEIARTYQEFAERLAPLAAETTCYLQDSLRNQRRLVFEGAHGTLLDIDHGTYPYVTSSSSSAVGVPAGAGVPPGAVQNFVGVVKAYTTRVGQGPFPTEQNNEIGERIRTQGHEFGTTTGRPRRCGWFDAFAGRYAAQLGGVRRLAVMHLDTLRGLSELKICIGYELDGRRLSSFPAEADVLEQITPIYETLPGWQDDLSSIRRYEQLPTVARNYIERLEQLMEVPVWIISVGPDRSQTIFRDT